MQIRNRRSVRKAPTKRAKRKGRQEIQQQEVVGRIVELNPSGRWVRIQDERTNQSIRIDLSQTRFHNMTDANGDGRYSAADLFPGDRIRARCRMLGKILKARTLWRIGATGQPGGLRRLMY